MIFEIYAEGQNKATITDAVAKTLLGKSGIGVVVVLAQRDEKTMLQFPSVTARLDLDEARELAAAINRQCDQFALPAGVGVQ